MEPLGLQVHAVGGGIEVTAQALVEGVAGGQAYVIPAGASGSFRQGRGAQAGHQDGVAGVGAACPGGAALACVLWPRNNRRPGSSTTT